MILKNAQLVSNYSERRENNEEPSVCHISPGHEPRTCVGLVQIVSSVIIDPHSECTLPVKMSFSANSAPLVDEQNILQVTDHDEHASVNLLDASVENESEIHYKNIAKGLGFNSRFYTKLNVWGSLGLNFDYDGGPIIENGGSIFLYKRRNFGR